jgi:hypothetical protein
MWVSVPGPPYRQAWVEWIPPQRHLQYPELYIGVWEYLRLPPSHARMDNAREYLASLIANTVHPYDSPHARLQRDRIQWVQVWLAALDPVDDWFDARSRKLKPVIN